MIKISKEHKSILSDYDKSAAIRVSQEHYKNSLKEPNKQITLLVDKDIYDYYNNSKMSLNKFVCGVLKENCIEELAKNIMKQKTTL